MASFNEVDGSSYSNVATTVSGDIDSISHSGGTVTMRYRIKGKNTSQWSQNSMVFWVNGTKYYAFNNTSGSSKHTTVGNWYGSGYETQTFSVPASSTSFTVSVPMSQKYWDPSGSAGSVTLTVSGVPVSVTTPTINDPSITNIGRTTANSSFSVSNNGGASIVDNYIDCGTTNFGNVVSTISSTSGTFSGLTPNTTYYVRANASNGTYRGYSAVKSFKTTGNAPSIGTITTTPARTSCSFSIPVTYDTNDNFSSRTIEYGTSTSYGSSVTGTSITGLSPNTTYYYRVTVYSTQGRSSSKTGNFRTTGNPPTIGARTVTPTKVKTALNSKINIRVSYSTTYDNASYSSHSMVYGTTTAYGSSATSAGTGANSAFTISNLEQNKTYYYKITETDSDSLSSTATGSFTTPPGVKVITSGGVTNARVKVIK